MTDTAVQNEGKKSQKKIVVVDDNEILLRAWNRLLEKQDCVPFVTTNPHEALDLLKLDNIDVLIADVVMPHMDGFELIRKAQEIKPGLRVILTTGYTCDFTRIRLYMNTSDIHVLLKPYNDIEALQKFMHRVIEGDESLDTEDSFKNPDDIRIHVWNL